MARVNLKFEDGTIANLEGSPEEVAKLVKLLRGGHGIIPSTPRCGESKDKQKSRQVLSGGVPQDGAKKISLVEIVNTAKSCAEAVTIESQILDRSSQVDRVLLPLFILNEHFKNLLGLTSGEISTITKELGIPIQQPNVAKTLSGTASKYVMGDAVRRKGSPVRYKLSRKGVHYMKAVLAGS